jgi:tetratricopeptide (TPR) repeat protein
MKNKKKKNTSELPKNYRFITDKLKFILANKYFKIGAFSLIYTSLIILISFLSFDFYNYYSTQENLKQEREKTVIQIATWKNVIEKYPNFKDAYLQLGALEYKIGDFEKAKEYVKKALVLDPEYSDAIELNKRIDGN